MSSGAVWACCGGVLVGSGEFWWVLVSSVAILVCFGVFWRGSGEFYWDIVGSCAVLVQLWYVLVGFLWVLVNSRKGSGEFWCSSGVFWCVLVVFLSVLVGFWCVLVVSGEF